MTTILARVKKSETAELRVTSSKWKGRDYVDFRLWYVPEGQSEYVASTKGVAIDASKLTELVATLTRSLDVVEL